jgi:hypothetical protein
MPLRVWLVTVLLLGACASPRTAHHKPSPPLAVSASAQAVGGGAYDVTVVATPAVALDGLTLAVVDSGAAPVEVGTVAAGRAYRATVRVQVDGPGAELIAVASARVAPGHTASQTASVTVGTPARAPEPATRTITLPSGRRVDEVR